MGPGLVIPACGSTTVSLPDYEAARIKGGEMAANDQTWDAPAGALVWTSEAMAAQRGATGTFTVVVSSTADPEGRIGAVADFDLPTCGGQPLGIWPGLPQGTSPEFPLPSSP